MVLLAEATPPEVSNVIARQEAEPSELVRITYDLEDAEQDSLQVYMQASSDGGTTWNVPVATVYGDIGPGVSPGSRTIAWDAGEDFPGVVSSTMRVRIRAEDEPIPGGGMVAYYPFNGNALDESYNGNHGTVYEATLTEDRFGIAHRAYRFDGSNDRITTDKWITGMQDDWTISAWFLKHSASGNARVILLHRAHNEDKALFLDSDNRVRYEEHYAAGLALQFYTSALPAEVWYHLAMVSNSDSLSYYLDGQRLGALAKVFGSSDWDRNYYGTFIGGNGHDPWWAGTVNGNVDDVRIYSRSLSAAEILALYHEGERSHPRDTIEVSTDSERVGLP